MERKGHDPDINPDLSALNIYKGFQTAAELMAYSDEHCSTLRDAGGRSLRKDAVRMCVTILKPPAAMMNAMTTEEQMRFLTDGEEKLREIIGSDNVKSSAWHFDEQGAHVHIFWEPMTADGRLCAKEMHGLHFLGRLNREMPEYLRSKGWDIDDCNAYDAAQAKLMTEQEKSERRQKNGRSS
ncbi:MAG: plasmid recombination protein, partial [Muribaculaceae bacterium]|nr:plasmid recombination protein [Muribaculaceae bacterium]